MDTAFAFASWRCSSRLSNVLSSDEFCTCCQKAGPEGNSSQRSRNLYPPTTRNGDNPPPWALSASYAPQGLTWPHKHPLSELRTLLHLVWHSYKVDAVLAWPSMLRGSHLMPWQGDGSCPASRQAFAHLPSSAIHPESLTWHPVHISRIVRSQGLVTHLKTGVEAC